MAFYVRLAPTLSISPRYLAHVESYGFESDIVIAQVHETAVWIAHSP